MLTQERHGSHEQLGCQQARPLRCRKTPPAHCPRSSALLACVFAHPRGEYLHASGPAANLRPRRQPTRRPPHCLPSSCTSHSSPFQARYTDEGAHLLRLRPADPAALMLRWQGRGAPRRQGEGEGRQRACRLPRRYIGRGPCSYCSPGATACVAAPWVRTNMQATATRGARGSPAERTSRLPTAPACVRCRRAQAARLTAALVRGGRACPARAPPRFRAQRRQLGARHAHVSLKLTVGRRGRQHLRQDARRILRLLQLLLLGRGREQGTSSLLHTRKSQTSHACRPHEHALYPSQPPPLPRRHAPAGQHGTRAARRHQDAHAPRCCRRSCCSTSRSGRRARATEGAAARALLPYHVLLASDQR